MSNRRLTAYAPIFDFHWDGGDIEFESGLWMKKFDEKPNLLGLEDSLSRIELQRLSGAHHWLVFETIAEADNVPTEVQSLFLLSLWLAKATETQVDVCFLIDARPEGDRQTIRRFGERFASLPGDAIRKFDDTDIQSARSYYSQLWATYRVKGRLNDALLLTLAGCVSLDWRAALICHSAAVEAFLTYATGSGITRRLATTCACLLEAQQVQRDIVFKEFCSLYKARSDIMHGRTCEVPQADRLETLRRFQDLLRRLWRMALTSPSLSSILEGTDTVRKEHFLAVEHGYVVPKL